MTGRTRLRVPHLFKYGFDLLVAPMEILPQIIAVGGGFRRDGGNVGRGIKEMRDLVERLIKWRGGRVSIDSLGEGVKQSQVGGTSVGPDRGDVDAVPEDIDPFLPDRVELPGNGGDSATEAVRKRVVSEETREGPVGSQSKDITLRLRRPADAAVNGDQGRAVIFDVRVAEGLGARSASSVTEGLRSGRLVGSSVTEGLGAGCNTSVTEGLPTERRGFAIVRAAVMEHGGPKPVSVDGVLGQGLPNAPPTSDLVPVVDSAVKDNGAVVIEVVLVVTVTTVPARLRRILRARVRGLAVSAARGRAVAGTGIMPGRRKSATAARGRRRSVGVVPPRRSGRAVACR